MAFSGKWNNILKSLDVVAIVIASVGAIVLHHLGLIPEAYVISILLLLLALHALQESIRGEEFKDNFETIKQNVLAKAPETELIKPSELLTYTEEVALKNRGEVWWFNSCSNMFSSQRLFDSLLKPSIESPKSTRVIFVQKASMKGVWDREVQPKIEKCGGRDKVQAVWCNIDENIAFQMIDVGVDKEAKEALVAVWGEPFMMDLGKSGEQVPRYLIHIKSQSELIPRLKDIFVRCKLGSG